METTLREIHPSLNEHYEIVRSMGGTLCDCPLPVALAPAGMCPQCGVEGPFYAQALEHYRVTHKGSSPEKMINVPAVQKYRRINWYEAFKEQPDDVEWLFEPMLEAGTINALFGRPGLGKSLITLELAANIAKNGKRVLYLDNENRETDTIERLKNFGFFPPQLDNLAMYPFSELPPLDTLDGGSELARLADEIDPHLVVIDTATRFVEGDENNASTWLQLYRCSMVPLKSRKITVLRLDHPGKDDSRGQRGSSAKAGDVDSVWWLKSDGREDVLVLERLKTRSGHGESFALVKRHHNPLRHDWDAIEMFDIDPRVVRLVKWFDDHGIAEDLGRPKLRTELDSRHGSPACSTADLSLAARYRKARFLERQRNESLQQMQTSEAPF